MLASIKFAAFAAALSLAAVVDAGFEPVESGYKPLFELALNPPADTLGVCGGDCDGDSACAADLTCVLYDVGTGFPNGAAVMMTPDGCLGFPFGPDPSANGGIWVS